jgi:hypothetical protein
MTGLYVEIRRDGVQQQVEIDQLTDIELVVFAGGQPMERGWEVAISLAAWIRENVREDTSDA